MTTLLDVAIGVTLLYLSLSLIVTTVQELLAGILRLRAKHLYRSLAALLTGNVQSAASGPTHVLIEALYEHPLIRGSSNLARALPSYIPSRTFALALVDLVSGTETANARGIAANVTDPALKRTLTLLLSDADALARDANERTRLVCDRIETWFNDAMARASGAYKRRSQLWSLALALVVTIAFNADTLYVATRLWADETLRSTVVESARAIGESPAGTSADVAQLLAHVDQMARSGLPLGWTTGAPFRASSVLGWLLTALAVSLGAPFWFDVLTKAIRFRGTGPKVSSATGRVEARAS